MVIISTQQCTIFKNHKYVQLNPNFKHCNQLFAQIAKFRKIVNCINKNLIWEVLLFGMVIISAKVANKYFPLIEEKQAVPQCGINI